MSSSSSSTTSTPTRDSRRRKLHQQRKPLVRNSSLFGSIKNLVAAPLSRLFTFSSEEFDDEKDFSGKRRRTAPHSRDNCESKEDGPMPAKRMRVDSSSLSPPPAHRGGSSTGGCLDPPTSAFRQNSPSVYKQPSRSASITIPSTGLPDTHTRSTISPLRRQLSSGMIIDSRPQTSAYPRAISRDNSLGAIPIVGTVNHNPPQALPTDRPRDHSMPPLSGRPSFIMRSSATPQPPRDTSEPPPMRSLTTYPMFLRGPSQAKDQSQTVQPPTLGSIVDSQRHAQNPKGQNQRQKSLSLFSSSPAPANSQDSGVLRDLDFYRTPLVPTRMRAKSQKCANNQSDITDLFTRKVPLVLIGEERRVRLGRRGSKKEKKEPGDNESKPYAGTTGLKKRLAKHRQDEEDEDLNKSRDSDVGMTPDHPAVVDEPPRQEIPLPIPPVGKDVFNLSTTSATSSSPQASTLRVGRATRAHISRPTRPSKTKFSAAFDEDEDISEESKKEMVALAEAEKIVPIFQIPAGFSFAKDSQQTEAPPANAKEPPITSLPFSLFGSSTPSVPAPAPTPTPVPTTFSFAQEPATASDAGEELAVPEGKVPNFFASSKILSSQSTPAPLVPSSDSAATQSSSAAPVLFGSSPSPFPTTTSNPPLVPVTISTPEPTSVQAPVFPQLGDTKKPDSTPAVSAPSLFSFTPQVAATEPASKPTLDAPFSFGKPPEEPRPASSGSSFSLAPPTNVASSGQGASLFGQPHAPTSGNSLFGNQSASGSGTGGLFNATPAAAPASSSLFGGTNGFQAEAPKPAPAENATTNSSLFGQSSSSPFTSNGKPKTDLFMPSSQSTTSAPPAVPSTSSSFSFTPTSPDAPKPPSFSFGQSSAPADTTPKPFSFGPPSSNSTDAAKGFSFGGSKETIAVDAPKPSLFGSSQPSPFAFGAGNTASASATTPSSSFSFGGGDSKPSGFSFGTSSRPITPPPNDDEVRMEESPTRDLQQRPAEPRPSLSGFGFGSNSSSSPFGQSSNANQTSSGSSPFAFGGGSDKATGNIFGGKVETPSTSSPFGFGQASSTPSSGSPFAFGANKTDSEQRPSTGGGFTFGQTQTPSVSTSAFKFGSGDSAPASPSTFGHAPPAFGNSPFTFGSQPASPATPSVSLPSSTPFGGAPTGGFGAPQPSGGGSLFTMGSSTAAAPADRQIKRLPNRRGGAKR